MKLVVKLVQISEMRITIKSKNLTITPALRIYIEQKILKPVGKLLKGIAKTDLPVLDLEFSRTTRHHRKGKIYYAEANLSLGKTRLRASVDDEDIRSACDFLEEELSGEIKRFRGRARALEFREARRAKKDLRFTPAARLYRKGRIRNEGN